MNESAIDEFKWYEIKVCVGSDAKPGVRDKIMDAIDEAVSNALEFADGLNDGTIWMESGPSDHNTEAAFDRLVTEFSQVQEDNRYLARENEVLHNLLRGNR